MHRPRRSLERSDSAARTPPRTFRRPCKVRQGELVGTTGRSLPARRRREWSKRHLLQFQSLPEPPSKRWNRAQELPVGAWSARGHCTGFWICKTPGETWPNCRKSYACLRLLTQRYHRVRPPRSSPEPGSKGRRVRATANPLPISHNCVATRDFFRPMQRKQRGFLFSESAFAEFGENLKKIVPFSVGI